VLGLLPTAGAAQEPLTLPDLVEMARRSHPELAAARARVEVARGKMIQAGLYPNPLLYPRSDEINNPDGRAGMVGMTFTQEVVTAGKLRLARAAAEKGVAAFDWQATTRWYDVLTRIRIAFFEALTAQRNVEANEAVLKLAQGGLDAAEKLLKAGTGTQPDVLRAQVELEQSRIRLDLARQRDAAARQLLAVAVGVRELPHFPLAGSLEGEPPAYEWEPVVETVLTRSSEIQEAQALVLQAEGLLQRARVEPIPNLLMTVRPFYSFPNKNTQALVEMGFALPVFNKNQGNIHAAEADVFRTREEARLVELRLTERLTLAYQRYQNARSQVEGYAKRVLPNAQESLRLVLVGYEKQDPKYDYTAVLQAQQTLAQARLMYVQALGDLWRAVSEIAGLLQQDDLAVAH